MYLAALFVMLAVLLSVRKTRRLLLSESLTAFVLVTAVASLALATGWAAA